MNLFFYIALVMFFISTSVCFGISVNFGNKSSDMFKYAQKELVDYLGKIYDEPVSEVLNAGDIIVGTVNSNSMIKNAVDNGEIKQPQGKNYEQGFSIKTIDNQVYILGHTDIGVLYGIYTFLESQGIMFQIDGERLPEKKKFQTPQIDISQSPVFKYRGVLPWDNFLCGMSGYNLEDYELLYTRLTRMKFNMAQYHFYTGMAYFTETIDGITANPFCVGMPVDIFRTKDAIGKEVFGDLSIWGVKEYIENIGNPQMQAKAVQEMFRKSIDFAHKLGWQVALGYEICFPSVGEYIYTQKPVGFGDQNLIDPSIPANIEKSVERFNSLKEIYPNADYYWLWNNEARGVLGKNIGVEDGAKEIREKYAHFSAFDGLEGDIDYGYLLLKILEKLPFEDRENIATGGWSINHMFKGMNKDFPKEIIFATLNSYEPKQATEVQMEPFEVARDGRRVWMIDWWEFDGEQWFPQFRVSWQEEMYRKCLAENVESVTLLGWKLSGIEHNVRYLADFSWNPNLTTEEFYKNYITKLYGKEAISLVENYMAYDKFAPITPGANPADNRHMLLGAGWMPLALPAFPSTKNGLNEENWKHIVASSAGEVCGIAGLEKLKKMDIETLSNIEKVMQKLDNQGKHWLKMLENRLEFRVIYIDSMLEVNKAIIEYDKIANEQGIKEAEKVAGTYTTKAVTLSKAAIEKYAEVIWNTNDEGVIAQLNVQFYKPLVALNDSVLNIKSKYVDIDWEAFRINSSFSFDFNKNYGNWHLRDGNVSLSNSSDDVLKLIMGGKVQYNSAVIADNINIEQNPYMDFYIKLQNQFPFAIMIQMKNDSAWYAVNFNGKQSLYNSLDIIELEPGAWHRITINLQDLIEEKINTSTNEISNIIIGCWDMVENPVDIEIRNFSFGKRNMLN